MPKADRPAVEEFTTLPHHLFTINNINAAFDRLVYGAAIEVVYRTIAKFLSVENNKPLKDLRTV